ncbi:MAG: hypothetical protein ACI9UN_002318 [Granulosicoccus sp.]|jgi:hypothetical protein
MVAKLYRARAIANSMAKTKKAAEMIVFKRTVLSGLIFQAYELL